MKIFEVAKEASKSYRWLEPITRHGSIQKITAIHAGVSVCDIVRGNHASHMRTPLNFCIMNHGEMSYQTNTKL